MLLKFGQTPAVAWNMEQRFVSFFFLNKLVK